MTNQQIIHALKQNPNLNIYALSLKIGISTMRISEAQHDLLKVTMSRYRRSEKWHVMLRRVDIRPWLTKDQFAAGMARIAAGEPGVYLELSQAHRMSVDYRAELRGAN